MLSSRILTFYFRSQPSSSTRITRRCALLMGILAPLCASTTTVTRSSPPLAILMLTLVGFLEWLSLRVGSLFSPPLQMKLSDFGIVGNMTNHSLLYPTPWEVWRCKIVQRPQHHLCVDEDNQFFLIFTNTSLIDLFSLTDYLFILCFGYFLQGSTNIDNKVVN